MKERKKILPQMFDVRPVDEAGDLDLEKIKKVGGTVSLSKEDENDWRGIGSREYFQKEDQGEGIFRENILENENIQKEDYYKKIFHTKRAKKERKKIKFDFEFSLKMTPEIKKKSASIFGIILISVCIIFILNFIVRGFELKKNGIENARAAVAEILLAKDDIKSGNFSKSYEGFNDAHEKLKKVSAQFSGMGDALVKVTKYIPYLSAVSSGSCLVQAADDFSQVGILISDMLKNLDNIKSGDNQNSSISYLKVFHDNENNLKQIAVLLADAQKNLDDVNVDDIPQKDRAQFSEMRQMLPEINASLTAFLGEEKLFNDILGGNGPRKYLFLFQNNQEMRATGGFIGSYGLLDIFNGRVRKFFIDGIFNPDGQLQTRIVPPIPIQKISANWSLHDSNWFPDFPTSARKAAWFYEKTGGPTVDGVITMTPTVMQKLLALTGPIDMPEYGVTVDKDNFIQKIQYQVEVDYDKNLNKPKKILGDLAPKILDKILNVKSSAEMQKAMNVMLESLNEKQILIYSKNTDIEKVLFQNNWSGEVLDTPKDYVSIINTNINGFKTDGVVDEKITHKAEIQADGSIIDTLTITRHHNGGDTPYEWWNKVNADYMRVYLPEGTKLLSAEGQTHEVNTPPLDYKALGYQNDVDVKVAEDSSIIDTESNTKIYNDAGKTVFANWVYVSPKETTTVKYSYILPFKININSLHSSDSYSLLAQKQSGSLGSAFISEVTYPSSYKTIWQSSNDGITHMDDLPNNRAGIKMETDLKTDKFIGVAFSQ